MAGKSVFNSLDIKPNSGEASSLTLYEPTGNFGVSLKGPTGLTGNVNFVLPTGPGSSGQILTSDGSGNTYWRGVTGPQGPTGTAGGAGTTGPTGPAGYQPFLIYTKSADESVADTTLISDAHLTSTTLSEGSYWIEINYIVSFSSGAQTASANLKAALFAQSGLGDNYGAMSASLRFSSTMVATNGTDTIGWGNSSATRQSGTSTPNGFAAAVIVPPLGSTTVTLKWAQNTSDATRPTVLKKGSQMLIWKYL